MATMTHRVTYAFDPKTTSDVDILAQEWNVSKSEAVRIAVKKSIEIIEASHKQTPLQALRRLREKAQVPQGRGMHWMKKILAERKKDLSSSSTP